MANGVNLSVGIEDNTQQGLNSILTNVTSWNKKAGKAAILEAKVRFNNKDFDAFYDNWENASKKAATALKKFGSYWEESKPKNRKNPFAGWATNLNFDNAVAALQKLKQLRTQIDSGSLKPADWTAAESRRLDNLILQLQTATDNYKLMQRAQSKLGTRLTTAAANSAAKQEQEEQRKQAKLDNLDRKRFAYELSEQTKLDKKREDNVRLQSLAVELEQKRAAITGNSIKDMQSRNRLAEREIEIYKELQKRGAGDYTSNIKSLQGSLLDTDTISYMRKRQLAESALTDATSANNLQNQVKAWQDLQSLAKQRFEQTGSDEYLKEYQSIQKTIDALKEKIATEKKAASESEAATRRINRGLDKQAEAEANLKDAEERLAEAKKANKGKNVAQVKDEITATQKAIEARRAYLKAYNKQPDEIRNDAVIKQYQRQLLTLKQQRDAIIANDKALLGMKNTLQRIAGFFGIAFNLQTITNFGRKIAETVGYFEQQQTALRGIIQDAATAETIFNQIKDFSVRSPFQFKELMGYTKQLSAFKVPADELFDTTKRLADISAGLGVDMQRIILAFGQVRSAAVLRGQELRQFTEAGIPLVDELAKKFTILEGRVISTGEVFEKISKREVSFEMVRDILFSMTEEGGRFHNMQERLAETTYGQIQNLKDYWTIAMSEMGQSSGSLINSILDLLQSLIQNWRRSLGTIGGMMTGGVITAGFIFIQRKIKEIGHGIKGLLVSIRQFGRANIWGLAVGTIVTIIGSIAGAIAQANAEAKKLKKSLDEISEKSGEKYGQLAMKFRELTKALEDTVEGSEAEHRVYQKILDLYSDYLPKQDLELQNLRNLKDGYDDLTKAILLKVQAQEREEKKATVMSAVNADIRKAVKGASYNRNEMGYNMFTGEYSYKPVAVSFWEGMEDGVKRFLQQQIETELSTNITVLTKDQEKDRILELLKKYLPQANPAELTDVVNGIINTAYLTWEKQESQEVFGRNIDTNEQEALEEGLLDKDKNTFMSLLDAVDDIKRDAKKSFDDLENQEGIIYEIQGLRGQQEKVVNKIIKRQHEDAEKFLIAIRQATEGLGAVVQDDNGDDVAYAHIYNGLKEGTIYRDEAHEFLSKFVKFNEQQGMSASLVSAINKKLEQIIADFEKDTPLLSSWNTQVSAFLDTNKEDLTLYNKPLLNALEIKQGEGLLAYQERVLKEYQTYKGQQDKLKKKEPSLFNADGTINTLPLRNINELQLQAKQLQQALDTIKDVADLINLNLDYKKKGSSPAEQVSPELSEAINQLKNAYNTYKTATQSQGGELGLAYMRNNEQFKEFFNGFSEQLFKGITIGANGRELNKILDNVFVSEGFEKGVINFEEAIKKISDALTDYAGKNNKRKAFLTLAKELDKWWETTSAKHNVQGWIDNMNRSLQEMKDQFDQTTRAIDVARNAMKKGILLDIENNPFFKDVDFSGATGRDSSRIYANIQNLIAEYEKLLSRTQEGENASEKQTFTTGLSQLIGGAKFNSYKSIQDLRNQLGSRMMLAQDSFGLTEFGEAGKQLIEQLDKLLEAYRKEVEDFTGEKYSGNSLADSLANAMRQTEGATATLQKANLGIAGIDEGSIKQYNESIAKFATDVFDNFMKDNNFDKLLNFKDNGIQLDNLRTKLDKVIQDVRDSGIEGADALAFELEQKFAELEKRVKEFNAKGGQLGFISQNLRDYRNADTVAKQRAKDILGQRAEKASELSNLEKWDKQYQQMQAMGMPLDMYEEDWNNVKKEIAETTAAIAQFDAELEKMGGEEAKLEALRLKLEAIKNIQEGLNKTQKAMSVSADVVKSVVAAFKSLASIVNKVYDVMKDGENPEWMRDTEDFIEDFSETFEEAIAPITAVTGVLGAMAAMLEILTAAGLAAEAVFIPLLIVMLALVAAAALIAGIVAAFKQHDRKLEHTIESLTERIEDLENVVTNLNAEAERQVGFERLRTTFEAIGQSVTKASAELEKYNAEMAKHNTDAEKAKEYYQNWREALDEFINGLKEQIDEITGAVDEWADSMSSAIRSAFQNGENAARAFRSSVKEMIGDIVETMLRMSILEPMIETAMEDFTHSNALREKYTSQYYDQETKKYLDKFDEEGYLQELLANLNDPKKAKEFERRMNEAGNAYIDGLASLDQTMRDYYAFNSDNASLSGGIESVTEDTARRLEALQNSQLGEVLLIRNLLQQTLPNIDIDNSTRMATIQSAIVQMNSNIGIISQMSQRIEQHINSMRNTSSQPLHVTVV